ncbi:DUF397 domain-containing protein [Streptomyces acidiscabies]|uniref:DUF397 domain-containing protein n=1 Tax=Streptomyces acidiscabies TaxID=42234 RepID=UPI0038F644C0
MPTPRTWRKSSYSGGGEGNNCVEIAAAPTHISIRDSKHPTHCHLTLHPTTFLQTLTPTSPQQQTP